MTILVISVMIISSQAVTLTQTKSKEGTYMNMKKVDFNDMFEARTWCHRQFRRTNKPLTFDFAGKWLWAQLPPTAEISVVEAVKEKLISASFLWLSNDNQTGNFRFAWIPRSTRRPGKKGENENMEKVAKIVGGLINAKVTPKDRNRP